jgi:uncharacterized membrane protein
MNKKAQSSLVVYIALLMLIFVGAIVLLPFFSEVTKDMIKNFTDPTQKFMFSMLFISIFLVVLFFGIKMLRGGASIGR